LPDTSERARQELSLQIALGVPLIATTGYTSPDVERVYARAQTLCQQVGETPQLFPVLWGLWGFHVVRAEFTTARALGEQCLLLAQSVRDPVLLLEAHRILGEALWCLGEFPTAQQHFEAGIALYDPQQHHSLTSLYGEDPGVFCHGMVSSALWLCGYPDRALKRIEAALTLARELAHPFNLGYALMWAAWFHQCRHERQAVQELAEAGGTLATEHGFPYWLACSTILRGWALAEQGQGEEGVAQVRQGLAAYRATGAEEVRSYFLALLAEACGKAGQIEEGLSVLAEALAFVHDTGERFHEAELYRLKGELTLQKVQVSGSKFQVTNPQAEAEEYFLKASDIARCQQAKSLELRAVMSLSRLWQRQGKKVEARQMLAEIYGWFTEGFDTKDLQEAKTLLAELHYRRQ
jgi:predicted ATPase